MFIENLIDFGDKTISVVPGNHEYYYNGTGQGDNSYFKIFNPGPNNGPEALQGSTGWFKHNDTLFILVDNVKSTGYDEQMKWMANLLETVDYSYSVAMFHIPVNFDNTDYDEKFLNLFDKGIPYGYILFSLIPTFINCCLTISLLTTYALLLLLFFI